MDRYLGGNNPPLSKAGLFNLFIVYIVWSTTYLAIRIMVGEGSGFSPISAGATRMIAAGLILLVFARIRNYRINISLKEWVILTATGILFWGTGSGLVMWAEQNANSGFTALVLASTPILVAFLDSLLARRLPSWLLVASLLLSFTGLGFLMAPALLQGQNTQLSAGLGLLLSALSSACGSILVKRYPLNLASPVMSGYQHLMAGLMFIALMVAFREPLPHPTSKAWLALAYLIVFGSVIAYTSSLMAIRLLPINIALTYAYVNPVLALFLGWLLLSEPITIWTLIGSGLVILGVIGVFRVVPKPKQAEQKLEVQ